MVMHVIIISNTEAYYTVIPEKLSHSKAVVPMAMVDTSDDKIEMTQNQVYGVPLASAAGHDTCDSITMKGKHGLWSD